MSIESIIITLSVMFFFGGIVLILGLGVMNIEEERSRNGANQTEGWDSRSFFSSSAAMGLDPSGEVVDDSLVLEVERFLRDEVAVADRFVSEPSVENLYWRVTSTVSGA